MKQSNSVFRVLFVEEEGLGQPRVDGVLSLVDKTEYVRAGSLREARSLLQAGGIDLVVADESRLRRVIDSIFTLVGLFSVGGVVVDVNQAPLTASGLRRDQVVGHRFIDLPWFAHSAEERSRIEAAIAMAAAGEPVRLETWIRSARDGRLMCIDAAFTPLRDQNNLITHVIGSGVDVTARKRAEEAMVASQSRLAEAQRVAHVGSWEWNVADNHVNWSDELFNIYAVDRADFIPSYEGFLSRVDSEDVEHTTAVIRQAVEDVTPFIYDHRIRRPDGEVRMLHTRGEVLADGAGKAARLVGSCWDVTDCWRATQQLEHSVSTLTATLEATADGILVGDRAGKVSALNQRFLAMWRLPRRSVSARTFASWVTASAISWWTPTHSSPRWWTLSADDEREVHDILRFKDGRVFEWYSMPQRLGTSICGRVSSFRDVTQREDLLSTVEARRAEAEARAQAIRGHPRAHLRRLHRARSNLALHVREQQRRPDVGTQRHGPDWQAHLDGVSGGTGAEVPSRLRAGDAGAAADPVARVLPALAPLVRESDLPVARRRLRLLQRRDRAGGGAARAARLQRTAAGAGGAARRGP